MAYTMLKSRRMRITPSFWTGVLAVILAAIPAWTDGQDNSATNIWRPSPPRLGELEKRAIERDQVARQNQMLRQKIQTLQGNLEATNNRLKDLKVRSNPSRLEELERKALGYETLQSTLEKRDLTIAQLTRDLEAQKQVCAELQKSIDGLKEQLGQFEQVKQDLEAAQKQCQETLEQFWLGNYEYYEVKDGDTLGSIAALPTVYGDANRAQWIRQANRGHVADLDHLEAGDVLIIPRFPPSGRYEF